MKFAQWLESQDNTDIRFASFSKDGTVNVYINGQKYTYITDAAYHNKWFETLEYIKSKKPQAYRKVAFSILNKIKDMVKKGHATQEFPKPQIVQFQPPTVEMPIKKVQKHLF